MSIQLLNAFSFNMIQGFPVTIVAEEVDVDAARALAVEAKSAVGHAETAAVFGSVLGMDVPAVRATIVLNKGDVALVGQYVGPRLPEGATKLPDGATIKWLVVTIA